MSDHPQTTEDQTPVNPQDFPDGFVGFAEGDAWDGGTGPATSEIQPEPAPAPQTEYLPPHTSAADTFMPVGSAARPSFSKLEKFSIIAIMAVLSAAAIFSVIHFSGKIPVNSPISKNLKLPAKGERFTVSSVETYWRKPNTQGEKPDIVRSGVELAPVLKINISGNEGAIRIFFRDSDGIMIGDSVSRNISGDETHEFIATDGLSNLGDHAAYRTGENPRWIIHVYEGPSADAPFSQFKRLFETKISADIKENTKDNRTPDTALESSSLNLEN